LLIAVQILIAQVKEMGVIVEDCPELRLHVRPA
jgi:hypothetical protein